MTSGNLSDEPIAFEDKDALERLDGLADGFLIHNRPIHMRVDDSVLRVVDNQPYPIRRSRGFAPDPIRLGQPMPEMLACGAGLKNTFCLSRDHYAFLSHHIGDLENYETLRSYEEGITHFEKLFRIQPESLVADLHPDYLSTKYALERSSRENLPLLQVQHHHAHLAACLADNHRPLDEKVIGLILKMGLSESVILSSFNARNLLKAKSLQPSIPRGLLTLPGLLGFPYRSWLGKRYHYDALHPYHKDVNVKMVNRLHAEGKKVNVWTVDKPADLLRMKMLGVDMVICNDPAHAREVLEAA